jgi:radical SAM superfamily enzyme
LSRQGEEREGNDYHIEKSLTSVRILLNRIIGSIEEDISFFSMLSENRVGLINILEEELERRKDEDSKGV